MSTNRPLPAPRVIAPPNLTRLAPQPLVRYAEICDTCGGTDTFRARCVVRGIVYVRCVKCGRNGTRTTILRPRPSPPHPAHPA